MTHNYLAPDITAILSKLYNVAESVNNATASIIDKDEHFDKNSKNSYRP